MGYSDLTELEKDAIYKIIDDGNSLYSLVNDYEITLGQLSRAFRELDRAIDGDPIALTALFTSLNNLKAECEAKALHHVRNQ